MVRSTPPTDSDSVLLHKMGSKELQRTLFDLTLGMQMARGYATDREIRTALERYGYDGCLDCEARVSRAQGILQGRGNVEAYGDECSPCYLYAR